VLTNKVLVLNSLFLSLQPSRRRDAERLHLSVEIAALDAEYLGRARHIALLLGQRPQNQVALELHYFEGLPLAEIAEVLGRPVGTIKSLLARGREMLREHLEELATSQELLASLVGELERWIGTLPELVRGQGEPTT